MYDVDPADPVAELEVADAADEVPTRASSDVVSESPGGDEAWTLDDDYAASADKDVAAGSGDVDEGSGTAESHAGDAGSAGLDEGGGTAESHAGDADSAGPDELDRAPLSEHPAIYERIHTELQQALAEIDGG